MKNLKNTDVIRAWKRGEDASNHRSSLTSWCSKLYSYRLHIATRAPNGATVLADYTASGEHFSQTTSCHVGLVRRSGVDTVMHPKVWETSTSAKA